MFNLFSKEITNDKRQNELDFAKGLAIIFMVIVHVNEVYQSSSYEGGIYNRIIEFIGSPPAAPVFMFALGLGIIYSKKSTSKYLFKRGIFMIILGYTLNFVRDFIPYSLLAIRDSDPSNQTEAILSLFGIDILPFAGLTFLFFAFIKKFKIKTKNLPLFWLFFSILNLLLGENSTDIYPLDAFLGLFWGTTDYSWFPFLSWIFFPILGYMFGSLLIHCNDKKRLYKICITYSFTALIPLIIYAYINKVHFGAFGELYQETYYHHDIMGNIILGDFTIFWISLIYFVSSYIPQNIFSHFSRWSKNVNLIYCIHWIILGYSMLIFDEESYSPLPILTLSFIFFILSDFISSKISKLKSKKVSKLSSGKLAAE